MKFRVMCLVSMWLGIHSSSLASEITFVFEQVGPDVVATGSGSVNLTGMLSLSNIVRTASVKPSSPELIVGNSASASRYAMFGGSSAGSIGSGSTQINATLSDGQTIGITSAGVLSVPVGYTSGSPLAGSSTWSNTTLAAMGLTVGSSWTFSWNSNAVVISISVVPEPSTIATGIVAAFVMGLLRRRQK